MFCTDRTNLAARARLWWTTAALLLTLLTALAPVSAQTRRGGPGPNEINLAVGEQYSIPATNIRNYSLAVPGVVDVRVPEDGSRLVLAGQAPGTTSLLVLREDGSQQVFSITVSRSSLSATHQQLNQLLQGFNNVSVSQVGSRLFIEGYVPTEIQQRRIQQIAAVFGGQAESLVSVDASMVERRVNIRVDLYFVELTRQSGSIFGLNWPDHLLGDTATLTAAVSPLPIRGMMALGLTAASATVVINQPLPRLDISSTSGWARVHRQSTLVTTNGTEATYHSGGELNFQIANGLSIDIRRIDYGTTLSVTPRYDALSSRLDLRVEADLSDVTAPDLGSNMPGRSISRVKTSVNLQLGQSMILSGIHSRSATSTTTGIPWLSQIPILGALFGSQSRRERDSEMVVFIVPTVIEGMTRQAEDRIAHALRAYEDFSGPFPSLPGNLVPRPRDGRINRNLPPRPAQ